tara:strand:+ start:283 stop:588 length:306 start_codon:yes stop_codon:yes gene_type:complete
LDGDWDIDYTTMAQTDTLDYGALQPAIVEMSSGFVANMSLIFRNLAAKTEIELLVTKALDLGIRQRKIENTTTFVELPRKTVKQFKNSHEKESWGHHWAEV